MDIRRPFHGERAQVEHTWQVCFAGEGESAIRGYFDQLYNREDTFVCLDGDVLSASVQIVPYTLRLRGRTLPVYALTGVCTLPEYRGGGRAQALIRRAVQEMRRRGGVLSFLHTDIPDFYRPMGWDYATDACRYAPQGRADPGGYRVEVVSRPDPAQLMPVYEGWSRELNAVCVRDKKAFEKRLTEAEIYQNTWYVAYDGAGRPAAYAQTEGTDAVEQAWLEERALQAVLARAGQVSVMLPRGMGLPGLPLEKCAPYNMMRCVDIPALLGGIPPDGSGSVVLAVDDPFAGRSLWRLESRAGHITVQPAQGEDAPVLALGAFTQWITGYRAGSTLVPGPAGRQMERILGPRNNFMFEIS